MGRPGRVQRPASSWSLGTRWSHPATARVLIGAAEANVAVSTT